MALNEKIARRKALEAKAEKRKGKQHPNGGGRSRGRRLTDIEKVLLVNGGMGHRLRKVTKGAPLSKGQRRG